MRETVNSDSVWFLNVSEKREKESVKEILSGDGMHCLFKMFINIASRYID